MAISATVAIKKFFEANDGKKVGMDELKKLSTNERNELGKLCCDELKEELQIQP